MCQTCGDEIGAVLRGQPLPISGICLCPPDFVMAFKVKGEDRWVVGRRLSMPETNVDETLRGQAEDDALEYLAGNYERWAIHCQHCGHSYADEPMA